MTEFIFNKNYRDYGQVSQFWDSYMKRYNELLAAGKYPYNDYFKGHLDGFVGTDKAQDTAIYLCQSRRHLADDQLKVYVALDDGYVPLPDDEITEIPRKYAHIVEYAFQNGETGFRRYESARLLRTDYGHLAVLPKGKRTNGHLIMGKILVKP